MVTRPEPRTPTLALALLLSSLLACKMFKKGEEEELPAVPSATAAPTVTEAAPPPKVEEPKPAAVELKLGDVKRFSDKEKKAEGVVKVLETDVKVFNEPDVKAPHVAELNKNIFVSRLATLDDFVLVEFPSGVGELSPGWVQARFLSDPDAKLTEDKVKQQAAATLVAGKKAATTSTSGSTSTTGGAKEEPAKEEPAKEEPKAEATTSTATTSAATTSAAASTTGGVRQIKRRKF